MASSSNVAESAMPSNRPVEDFVSARSAAKMLRVNNRTLDKLAQIHGLTVFQLPGNRRKWLVLDEIRSLLSTSTSSASK